MLIKFISFNANREFYHSKCYSALHHLSCLRGIQACICIASITSHGFPPSGQYVQTQSEISCRLSGSM